MVTVTRVKVVRAFLEINQSELSDQMSISTSLVSAIENRGKRIIPNFIRGFKRAVGITDSVLMDILCLQSELGE